MILLKSPHGSLYILVWLPKTLLDKKQSRMAFTEWCQMEVLWCLLICFLEWFWGRLKFSKICTDLPVTAAFIHTCNQVGTCLTHACFPLTHCLKFSWKYPAISLIKRGMFKKDCSISEHGRKLSFPSYFKHHALCLVPFHQKSAAWSQPTVQPNWLNIPAIHSVEFHPWPCIMALVRRNLRIHRQPQGK